jgi:glutamate--cysteine ligase
VDQFEKTLDKVLQAGLGGQLASGRKGLEKESLRVLADGRISQRPHLPGLGSALTHPYITTDYSEALLEFRTPPWADLDAGLDFLADLHTYTYREIAPELIWPASMPCLLGSDTEVPIAQYGSSNSGRMKYVYRQGLGYRYGRAMQAIAGIHFNYSLPESFWPVWQESLGERGALRVLVDRSYFATVRNFQRWGWLISYLFGASPAMCTSFARLRGGQYDRLGEHTSYGPYATSLRMSDSGYKNKNQAGLDVSYNSLEEYVRSLQRAISTVQPDYERIGVKVGDDYRQLNANILQIENEYYSFIRPKQIARSGEKPSTALSERGVQYIEVRALDLNPFDPLGAHASQLRFVEALLLACLFEENTGFSAVERSEVEHNQTKVACCGRDPGLRLSDRGEPRTVLDWAREILARVAQVSTLLDRDLPDKPYTHSLLQQMELLENVELLPSTRILRELRETGASYLEYSVRLARDHAQHFKARVLTPERDAEFSALAKHSLQKQQQMEASDTISFEQFLADYFR